MGYSLFTKKSVAKNKEYIVDTIKLILKNLEENKKEYKVFNILNIGRLMEGQAYYHEVDQYYNCIGFEIEVETQFEFSNGEVSELEKNVGFYSIWVGKSHSCSPFTFEESYQDLGVSHRFDNGLGDHISITQEIMSLEEVQEIIKKHNLI